MKPLERYNKVAKRLKIEDDQNVPVVARLGFAREQANQMKMIVNRFLFDITLAESRREGVTDPDALEAFDGKIREYERDLRQTREGLAVANELVKELEALVDAEA